MIEMISIIGHFIIIINPIIIISIIENIIMIEMKNPQIKIIKISKIIQVKVITEEMKMIKDI
jgi:hypothetical protein